MYIKRRTMEAILNLCLNAHPNEIGGLLLGNNCINDFVLLPGRFSPASIFVRLHQVPIYTNLTGSFHSHPGPNKKPSLADLSFFGKFGKIHIICAYPYDLNSCAAYDVKGRERRLSLK